MIGVGLSATLSGGRKARVNLDPMPALDLNFAANRSLPADYGPTPSFSRASTGTFFNSSGVLTSAAVNVPRFDHVYSGGSWVSRGLLVEEQRTNIAIQSNGFSTASWDKNRGTITANAASSPDGTSNANNFTQSTGQTTLAFLAQYTTTTANQFTQSVFAKANGKNYLVLTEFLSSSGGRFTYFNLSNGTIGTVSVGHTAKIENVGNGWYRCSITFTALAKSEYFGFNIGDSDNSFTCTDSGSVLFYGAQLESGSFPTSYIPTTSASTTRSADVCQIAGSDFSSFWNATEGSVAVEYIQHKPLNIGTVVSFFDGGTSNVLYDYASEGTSGGTDYGPSFYIRSGGTFTVENNNSPIGSGLQKYAVAFKSNDFAMSYLGASAKTDSTVTLPTVTQLGIGKPLFAQYPFSGHIARLRYYPTRLTNATLQSLST